MTMDPRLAARRRRVAEHHAKDNVRKLVILAGLAVVIGAVVWLLNSPFLSVRTLTIYGASQSEAAQILEDRELVEGRPLVAIRSGAVADALREDPWVRDASVELVFPDSVEITVVERRPAVWVSFGRRWGLVADDGVVVEYTTQRPELAPYVHAVTEDPGLGRAITDHMVLGAVDFVMALPIDLVAGTVLRNLEGEMWASVTERDVRLGHPADMAAKAAALAAIIHDSTGGVIDVIAPARPTFRTDHPGLTDVAPSSAADATDSDITGDSDTQGTLEGEG